MKSKLIVRPDIMALRFDEKAFFSTILRFTPIVIINTIMIILAKKLQI